MALNEPILKVEVCDVGHAHETGEWEIDDIFDNWIYELVAKINKEGFNITRDDLEYELFTRCEYIGIPSEKLYPEEDLPRLFGVQRGYNGGGIHSGLAQTEIHRLRENRKNKASRILGYFEEAFWGILKDVDELSERNSGQAVESWNSITL